MLPFLNKCRQYCIIFVKEIMKTNTNQMQIMTHLGACVSRTLVYCNALE